MDSRELRGKTHEQLMRLMHWYADAGKYIKATFVYDFMELYGKRVRDLGNQAEGKCISMELVHRGTVPVAIVKLPNGETYRTSPSNLEVVTRASKVVGVSLEERVKMERAKGVRGIFILPKYPMQKYLPLYWLEEPAKLRAARERLEAEHAEFEEHREKCFNLVIALSEAEETYGFDSPEADAASRAYFEADQEDDVRRKRLEELEREYQRVWKREVYEQIFSRKEVRA